MNVSKVIKVSEAHEMMANCQQAIIDSVNEIALETGIILDELAASDWSQVSGRIAALLSLVQATAISMAAVDTINSIVDPE